MVERVLFSPGGATEAKQDDIITEIQDLQLDVNAVETAVQALEQNGLTDAELRAAPVPVSLAPATLIKRTLTATASGDNTVYTPSAGTKIRLWFFGYSASSAVTGVTVILKLDGYNGGAGIDTQYLGAAGQPYARNIKAGDAYIEGSVDGLLIVNLSAAQNVHVNFEIEEI